MNNKFFNQKKAFFIMLCLVMITLLSMSCSPKKTFEPEEDIEETFKSYKQTADEMCKCSTSLFTLLKDLEQLSEKEKEEASKARKIQLDAELERAELCMATYLNQLQEEQQEVDRKMFDTAMKRNCPKLYQMLKLGKIFSETKNAKSNS